MDSVAIFLQQSPQLLALSVILGGFAFTMTITLFLSRDQRSLPTATALVFGAAAVLFVAANEFFVARFGASELNIAATGALLICALLFFPDGIVGTLKQKGRLPKALDWD
jgi:ABC-type branched-subunit amino acid transport system permease subunit